MELKKAGRRSKVTCEECGWVPLEGDAYIVWEIFAKYTHTIIVNNGMGGWSINPVGVEFIAKEYEIENVLLLLEYLEVVASECFKDAKEEKNNLPDLDEMKDEE